MPDSLLVVVRPGGVVQFLWDDRLAGLAAHGRATVTRASHVEWDPGVAGWVADLAPSGGPKLGPFARRALALDAERSWIEENVLLQPRSSVQPIGQPDPATTHEIMPAPDRYDAHLAELASHGGMPEPPDPVCDTADETVSPVPAGA